MVKRALPGYVFLKISKISDELIKFLRDTNHVSGFLGGSSPSPITEEEVQTMLNSVQSKREMLDAIPEFCIGDNVSIVEGAFEGFLGIVQSVDKEKSTLGVTLSIFGRENLVSVSFMQAKKGK
ncbi:transcription termination/antitermination protein NusG domain protein [Candidatus Fokinia solitaria]|nr:transcription termination/antitermination protein NusG [Candidatus Fokinia solitaria]AWD33142.1 transcription termination/antitermination protein NusG domain protein [Candidatus Fokinia solitaria]